MRPASWTVTLLSTIVDTYIQRSPIGQAIEQQRQIIMVKGLTPRIVSAYFVPVTTNCWVWGVGCGVWVENDCNGVFRPSDDDLFLGVG